MKLLFESRLTLFPPWNNKSPHPNLPIRRVLQFWNFAHILLSDITPPSPQVYCIGKKKYHSKSMRNYDWGGGGGITKYLLINCIPINHSRIQILKDLDIMVKFRQETHTSWGWAVPSSGQLRLASTSLELCASWGCLLSQLWLDLKAWVNCSLETTDTVLGFNEIA